MLALPLGWGSSPARTTSTTASSMLGTATGETGCLKRSECCTIRTLQPEAVHAHESTLVQPARVPVCNMNKPRQSPARGLCACLQAESNLRIIVAEHWAIMSEGQGHCPSNATCPCRSLV